MRLFMLVLIFLLGLQLYHLILGKNGFQENRALKKEVELSIASNKTLEQRNQMMYSEIEGLKQGSEAVAERARNELGLVKEGETFFRIVPKED